MPLARRELTLGQKLADLDRRIRLLESMQPGRQRNLILTSDELIIGGLFGTHNTVVGTVYTAGNVGVVCGGTVRIGPGGGINDDITITFPFKFADISVELLDGVPDPGESWPDGTLESIVAARGFKPGSPGIGASSLGFIPPGSDTAQDFVSLGTAIWGANVPFNTNGWNANGVKFSFIAVGLMGRNEL